MAEQRKLLDLFAEIHADGSPLKRDIGGIGRLLTGKFSDFGRTAGRLFAAGVMASIKLGIAGLTVGAGFGVLTLKLAGDMEESLSKFNVVFGESANRVQEWGDDLAKAVGRSRRQIIDFLASSQDLFVPLGFASDEAERMSKTVTQLAIDLGSFNNRADDDVLRDLQAALTGSGEVMKKYGVIVSEATVAQEAFQLGMNPKALTETEKVTARLSLITKGTTAAWGDSIRTAGSFTNQLKRLKGSLVDVGTSLGQRLLPVATELLTVVGDVATAFFDLQKSGDAVAGTFAIDATSAAESLVSVLAEVVAMGKRVAATFMRVQAAIIGFQELMRQLSPGSGVSEEDMRELNTRNLTRGIQGLPQLTFEDLFRERQLEAQKLLSQSDQLFDEANEQAADFTKKMRERLAEIRKAREEAQREREAAEQAGAGAAPAPAFPAPAAAGAAGESPFGLGLSRAMEFFEGVKTFDKEAKAADKKRFSPETFLQSIGGAFGSVNAAIAGGLTDGVSAIVDKIHIPGPPEPAEFGAITDLNRFIQSQIQDPATKIQKDIKEEVKGVRAAVKAGTGFLESIAGGIANLAPGFGE
jgi:hypothetical protein